jgi:hypothetical protein
MGLGIIADYSLLFPTAAIVGFAYGMLWVRTLDLT